MNQFEFALLGHPQLDLVPVLLDGKLESVRHAKLTFVGNMDLGFHFGFYKMVRPHIVENFVQCGLGLSREINANRRVHI